jgi:transglutaminase-like putative cysteine protease
VIIPASRTLNWSYRNLDNYPLLPRIEKSANRVSYSWERHNIPAIVEEANRPPFNEIVSSVACSMFADWQPIYEWNGDKLAKHMAETSPEITKQVEELTAGLMSDEEKIAAIYYWVQKEIRYISIKGDVVAGLAGHPARETFEKKYGDCVDKSVLMCAMLRQLGFDAHPVGAMTNGGGEWHQDIPRFYANHSFVYLRLKDGSVRWLDPTTTNYRYPYFREDDMGVMALVPTLKTRVRTSNPVIYEREYQKMITLDKSGSIEVKNAVQLAGSTEAAYRGYLKQLKDEERQDALEKIIGSSYSGASVLSPFEFGDVDELAKPFFLNQHYQVKNYAVIASDLMVFALPGIDKNYSGLVLEKRTYPIDYQVHTAFKGTIEVKIPAGYQLEYLPESLKFSNDYFNYQAEYLKTATGFTFTEDFQRVKCFIPVEEYKLFRDSARKIQDFTDKKVVLKQLTEGEEK